MVMVIMVTSLASPTPATMATAWRVRFYRDSRIIIFLFYILNIIARAPGLGRRASTRRSKKTFHFLEEIDPPTRRTSAEESERHAISNEKDGIRSDAAAGIVRPGRPF
jgi:hypothetical protein